MIKRAELNVLCVSLCELFVLTFVSGYSGFVVQ